MYPFQQQQQQQQPSNLLMNTIDHHHSSWKKSLLLDHNHNDPIDNADSTGSILNLSDLSESNAAFIGTVCLASGFVLLVLFASIYYYRKRSLYHDFTITGSTSMKSDNNNNKILLLKKNLQFNEEKPYVVRQKTPAVRSPSSSQVNPFNKKSPSPTGGLSPNDNEMKNVNRNVDLESGRNSQNNSKHCSPIAEEQQQTTTQLANNNNSTNVAKNLGKLHFKLKYSYEKRALCLAINRCTDLQAKDAASTLDPYVKIQLLPEKQHKAKTRVLRKSLNPIYNEEFTFYGITSNLLEMLAIHFVILNFDRFSRDEILGEVVCRLNQFEFDSLEKQLTLCRDIVPLGNKLKIQDLGELLVSLCYQPIANRLTVVILKARNLPKMDLTGLCDPYVKIYVFHNGERISKKRTHIKRRTLSPVFNESFVFDIPADEGLDNIHLQFMIYDHDRVTRNELIGKVEIGSKTGIPATEKHWHEVIKSPRRQIAEWHKLREVTSTTMATNN
nr:synaptotagmin-4-like [Dermatophagoides farinae]